MNKTITVNIGGRVFNIEEDAYELLHTYLMQLRERFSSTEGSDEILADIEVRIAELLEEYLKVQRTVVTPEDINRIISTMGRPEDYGSETEDEPAAHKVPSRKVFRDPDDRVIGGVASGLSHFLGWDPLVLRILFVIFTIAGFTAIPAYIILWIVIPEAKTTAEKLKMRGERINVDNISKAVNEGYESMKDSLNGQKTRNGFSQLGKILEQLFTFLANFIRVIAGVFVMLFGIMLSLALIMIVIAAFTGFGGSIPNDPTFWSEIGFVHEAFFPLAVVAFIALMLPPSAGLIYGGLRLLLRFESPVKGFGISLAAVFLIGAMLGGVIIFQQANQLSHNEEISEDQILELNGNTLYVRVSDDPFWHNELTRDDLNTIEVIMRQDDTIYFGYPELKLRTSRSDKLHIELNREARGHTRLSAIQYAKDLQYTWSSNADTLILPPYFSSPAEHKFRAQELDLTLHIPDSVDVQFIGSLERIADGGNRIGEYRIRQLRNALIGSDSNQLYCKSCAHVGDTTAELAIGDKTPDANTSITIQ